MIEDVPQAPNLDSHSPFSSGSLPCCEACACGDTDSGCGSILDLTRRLQFLLDGPLEKCVELVGCHEACTVLDVLRDICSLTSALADDRSAQPHRNLPTIVKLLRCFIAIAQSGEPAAGQPLEPRQSALLLADVYFLLAHTLWKLHGNTEPADGFGWSTQGAEPDASKVEEAERLMQLAQSLHAQAKQNWGVHSGDFALHCDVVDVGRTMSHAGADANQQCGRAIPANMVPASRIMTCLALISKARRRDHASLELLKHVASMEPWVPEYELRPSAVQASHRQSVTFAHLCLVRHYTDVGNFNSAMYHSKTAIAAKMHYERDVMGLHEWEIDALWEQGTTYPLHYTSPRQCELPPNTTHQQLVDALCQQASESTSPCEASSSLALALQHAAAVQGKCGLMLLKPALELLRHMISTKCTTCRGYAHAAKLGWYTVNLARLHARKLPRAAALEHLERAEAYTMCALLGQEKWCEAYTHARHLLSARLQAHGASSPRVMALRPWIAGLLALKVHKSAEAMNPKIGSPCLARRRPTLPANMTRHTATLAERISHHLEQGAASLGAHLLAYLQALTPPLSRPSLTFLQQPPSPCSTWDGCGSPSRAGSACLYRTFVPALSISSRESNDSRGNPCSFDCSRSELAARVQDSVLEEEHEGELTSGVDPRACELFANGIPAAAWAAPRAASDSSSASTPHSTSPTRKAVKPRGCEDADNADAAFGASAPRCRRSASNGHQVDLCVSQGPPKRNKRLVSFASGTLDAGLSPGKGSADSSMDAEPVLCHQSFRLLIKTSPAAPSSSPTCRDASPMGSSASTPASATFTLTAGHADQSRVVEARKMALPDLVAAVAAAEEALGEDVDKVVRALGGGGHVAPLPRPEWASEVCVEHWLQTLEALNKLLPAVSTAPTAALLASLTRTIARMAPPSDGDPCDASLEPFPASDLLRLIAYSESDLGPSDPCLPQPLDELEGACARGGSPQQQHPQQHPPPCDTAPGSVRLDGDAATFAAKGCAWDCYGVCDRFPAAGPLINPFAGTMRDDASPPPSAASTSLDPAVDDRPPPDGSASGEMHGSPQRRSAPIPVPSSPSADSVPAGYQPGPLSTCAADADLDADSLHVGELVCDAPSTSQPAPSDATAPRSDSADEWLSHLQPTEDPFDCAMAPPAAVTPEASAFAPPSPEAWSETRNQLNHLRLVGSFGENLDSLPGGSVAAASCSPRHDDEDGRSGLGIEPQWGASAFGDAGAFGAFGEASCLRAGGDEAGVSAHVAASSAGGSADMDVATPPPGEQGAFSVAGPNALPSDVSEGPFGGAAGPFVADWRANGAPRTPDRATATASSAHGSPGSPSLSCFDPFGGAALAAVAPLLPSLVHDGCGSPAASSAFAPRATPPSSCESSHLPAQASAGLSALTNVCSLDSWNLNEAREASVSFGSCGRADGDAALPSFSQSPSTDFSFGMGGSHSPASNELARSFASCSPPGRSAAPPLEAKSVGASMPPPPASVARQPFVGRGLAPTLPGGAALLHDRLRGGACAAPAFAGSPPGCAPWSRSCSMPSNRLAGVIGGAARDAPWQASPAGPCGSLSRPGMFGTLPRTTDDCTPFASALHSADDCQIHSGMKAHTLACSLDMMFDGFDDL